MIRTILIGSYILVQGLFERREPDGTVVVRVGTQTFSGKPVTK